MKGQLTSKDFYLSAYLKSQGFQLNSHKREQGFTTFIFENSQKLQKLINQFYSLKAQIEPVKYRGSYSLFSINR